MRLPDPSPVYHRWTPRTHASGRGGPWYIGIRAYSTYSGANLSVTYDSESDSSPEPDEDEITNGQTISNLSASRGEWIYYHINVPSSARDLRFQISGGSGDADLYTRLGVEPTTSVWDCRPYRYGNNETCLYSSPNAGQWFVGIRAYRAFSGLSLTVTHD